MLRSPSAHNNGPASKSGTWYPKVALTKSLFIGPEPGSHFSGLSTMPLHTGSSARAPAAKASDGKFPHWDRLTGNRRSHERSAMQCFSFILDKKLTTRKAQKFQSPQRSACVDPKVRKAKGAREWWTQKPANKCARCGHNTWTAVTAEHG